MPAGVAVAPGVQGELAELVEVEQVAELVEVHQQQQQVRLILAVEVAESPVLQLQENRVDLVLLLYDT
jgi:hypothetical protein